MSDERSPVEAHEVFLHGSGADARGALSGERLTVHEGSVGRASETPSLAESFRRRRADLVADGSFLVDGDSLIVQKDLEFESPSGAAITLMGRHANGWREWGLADGTPIDSFRSAPADVQEQAFRRRWFEAQQRAFTRDVDWVARQSSHQRARDESGQDAIGHLSLLETTRDVAAFVESMQTWAVSEGENKGFNGFSGQMLLNQLVKRSESAAELADVLADVLRAPADAADACSKIQRMIDHIEQIRVGAHPAPGHAPFLLSYFWALQNHETWPVIWASATAFAEFITGEPLPAMPADRYAVFVDFVAGLDTSNEEIEWTAAWWADERPVLLDAVLVDRSAFGLDDTNAIEVRQANAGALVAVAQHVGSRLSEKVSHAVGRTVEAKKPSKSWREHQPRADLWVDWRIHEGGIGVRLWINHTGVSIGVRPGWARSGWYDEVAPLAEAAQLEGFRMIAAPWSKYGEDVGHEGGLRGEFTYARWFEPEQLADLDVEQEVTAVAVALQPLLDELVRRATGLDDTDTDDPLTPSVDKFRVNYPSTKDEQQFADRAEFAATLAADAVALADPMELRRIWNTGRYGSPGPQSNLNTTVRDADAAEFDRIIDTFRYVCWGDGDDAARIDEVLDLEGERYVKGLGESVIMKMLSICHPDRYLPVFPYSGPKGKRRMLQVLGLPEPEGDSRGTLQVEANDRLRQRLDKFFPGDAWGMAQFLYRYSEGLETDEEEAELDVDPIEQLADDLLVDRAFLDDIIKLLEDKRQVILYGPPGTGKTYLAQKLAEALVPDATRRPLVQFHPSMSYEDFFEGYRPETDPNGALSYRLTPGPLALLAARAMDAPGKRHIMIIDEINRANLPRVLGELLFLLEYRDVQVPTLYRPDDPFELPADIWFIGTMNTADRSIALVDAALRRRFHFVPFFPNHGPMQGLLDRWLKKNGEPAWVGELVAMVNDQLIEALSGPHLQIGPSYFMKKALGRDAVRRIWEYNIEPFIEDQFFGDTAQIERFRFEAVMASYLGSVGVGSLDELAAAQGESGSLISVDVVEAK